MDTRTCPHCQAELPSGHTYVKPLEGGSAYAEVCAKCNAVINIRPHEDTDPPAVPPEFNAREAEHLKFMKAKVVEEGHKDWVIEAQPLVIGQN